MWRCEASYQVDRVSVLLGIEIYTAKDEVVQRMANGKPAEFKREIDEALILLKGSVVEFRDATEPVEVEWEAARERHAGDRGVED